MANYHLNLEQVGFKERGNGRLWALFQVLTVEHIAGDNFCETVHLIYKNISTATCVQCIPLSPPTHPGIMYDVQLHRAAV